MNFLQSSKSLYTLAFLLIIVTNIFVLIGTYSNKLGEATSSVVLTQRELRIPYSSIDENSGVSLKIRYRVTNDLAYRPYASTRNPIWLDELKLQKLGFDTQKQKKYQNRKSNLKKEVFFVLELNGESYKKQLELSTKNLEEKKALLKEDPSNQRLVNNVKDAKRHLHREKTKASRLYIIDAGLSYEKLRDTYKDKAKYIIAKGIVRSYYKKYKASKLADVKGYITGLSISEIHVEKSFKNKLQDKHKKFNVHVEYGSRYEPWVSEVILNGSYKKDSKKFY